MGLFRRGTQRWEPPGPRCAFVVSCAGSLPEPQALTGVRIPAEGALVTEKPYSVGTEQGGRLEMTVTEAAGGAARLPDRDIWPYVGLTPDLARRVEEARYDVGLLVEDPGESVADTVLEATKLAAVLASIADGCVEDAFAARFFGPDTWRVDEPLAEVDVREHVTVHTVPGERPDEGLWVHTHGLIKFGRPEFEIYDVPEDMGTGVAIALNDMGQYVLMGALISPGETLGDRAVPLQARLGQREREHWEDLPVLELVDVDESGQPVESGAVRGLRAWWPEHFEALS